MLLRYVVRLTLWLSEDREDPKSKKTTMFCVVDPNGMDHFELFKLILFEEIDGEIVKEEISNISWRISRCEEHKEQNLASFTRIGPFSTDPCDWERIPFGRLDPKDYEIDVNGNLVKKT